MKSKIPPRAAGLLIFRRTPEGVRLLILRAYRNWDFAKGTIETSESELEAARREAAEETGLGDVEFPYGEVYSETPPYAGGKVARYYIAQTEVADIVLPVSPELGRPENHEWRWVSFDEAMRLLPARLQPTLVWARGVIHP